MNKVMLLSFFFVVAPIFAEESFEINKKNCNLPMKKIKQLVSDKKKQKKIYRQCIEKAMLEKWKRRSLIKN
ncbi:MAG: hypothetical protein ACWIPH_03270 [Ostreibacterium sp.]